jgi:hypothetical protein
MRAVRPDEVILAHLCYPCMCGCYVKITGWSILAWIAVGRRKELLRSHIHQLSYKVRACLPITNAFVHVMKRGRDEL